MTLAQASASNLGDVKKLLQDPLTGRKVLIPFTSKAFFEGALQPTIDAAGSEQVLVKLSKEHFVESNRSEAAELLEKRIQAVQKSVRDVTTSRKVPRPAAAPAEPSGLPFFEIREEFDQQGNEIRSEAINVAKELEYLERNEDDKVDAAIRVTPPSSDAMVVEEEATSKAAVSEEEYQDLASRLEELAKLEEEAEAKKKTNQTSSKRLQGSGWSKGFLNKKKPAKKKPVKSAVAAAKAPVATAVTEQAAPRTAKKVGFQEKNNQIKEIPRVGERSVPSRTITPVEAAPSRQIETSVFNGVIQERPAAAGVQERSAVEPKKKLSRFAQQRLDQQQEAAAVAPRKVSKFAQERQQQIR
jgi:hypothetical protein